MHHCRAFGKMVGVEGFRGLGVYGFRAFGKMVGVGGPQGPCTQIVYLYRDYLKATVYTIWIHGPVGGCLAT